MKEKETIMCEKCKTQTPKTIEKYHDTMHGKIWDLVVCKNCQHPNFISFR